MLRLDLYHFYQLGYYVHPLTEISGLAHPFGFIANANIWLRLLIDPPHEPIALPLSISAAQQLMDASSDLGSRFGVRLLSSYPPNTVKDDVFFTGAIAQFEAAAKSFEAVFEHELMSAPAYFVSRKGAYDMAILVEHAEAAFGGAAIGIVSEQAVRDFREAGRCLAFDAPTACGYHSMRAVEAVLRQWHALQMKKKTEVNESTEEPSQNAAQRWAKVERELLDAGAPKGTIGVLTQIRELHRNPLMHPQSFLAIEDALGLFDISKSAIEAMGREIVKLTQ